MKFSAATLLCLAVATTETAAFTQSSAFNSVNKAFIATSSTYQTPPCTAISMGMNSDDNGVVSKAKHSFMTAVTASSIFIAASTGSAGIGNVIPALEVSPVNAATKEKVSKSEEEVVETSKNQKLLAAKASTVAAREDLSKANNNVSKALKNVSLAESAKEKADKVVSQQKKKVDAAKSAVEKDSQKLKEAEKLADQTLGSKQGTKNLEKVVGLKVKLGK